MGYFFSAPMVSGWYKVIAKPSFAPPNWVFLPVWVTLYLLMGISAYLIWKKGLASKEARMGIFIFVFQLFLNVFWSVLFFGIGNFMAALIEIVSLLLAIIATIMAFSKTSKISAILLLPYVLWVAFASILNFFIWRMN
jgi:tryptophan-rich sensory protein